MQTPTAPGIYPGIPFIDYLAWRIMSQSVLKAGGESMAHLKAAWDRDRIKVPTDAMMLGSALHCAFLEPELMPSKVVRWEGGTRRGKAWDGFRADHPDQIILTPPMHDKLIGMVRALRAHPVVRKWSNQIEQTEVSAIGDVYGLRMKGRVDALTPDPIFDLKLTRSTDPRTVANTIMEFGYHIQAAIYTHTQMFDRNRMILAMVEDKRPYDVVPYELSPQWLRLGERTAASLIHQYRECLETDIWPGRSDAIVLLDAPEWALKDLIDEDEPITLNDEVMA